MNPNFRAKITLVVMPLLAKSEAYPEPSQISKMECFAKIVNDF